jgi:hypothetical protein
MLRATHRWQVSGDFMASFTTEGLVQEEDWGPFIKAMKTSSIKRFVSLSTGIAEINSIQRKEMSDLFKTLGCLVAVVTDERTVRGIVTAIVWLGVSGLKAFSRKEIDDALRFVGVVTPQERAVALNMISQLQLNAKPK